MMSWPMLVGRCCRGIGLRWRSWSGVLWKECVVKEIEFQEEERTEGPLREWVPAGTELRFVGDEVGWVPGEEKLQGKKFLPCEDRRCLGCMAGLPRRFLGVSKS
jgi:hypothetical protein